MPFKADVTGIEAELGTGNLLAETDSLNAVTTRVSEGKTGGSAAWHILLATWLGGVFDGMDSSLFAMVLYPALSQLLNTTSHAVVGQHGSYIVALFLVGWAIGALIFGILADYIGRARTLTITILLYAICTGLCGTANTWWELGFYRFLVGAGIGGEMGTAAVMLSESWPNKSRALAVSFMATSLGVGYILTACLNLALGHHGWRWLFFAGIIPAVLTVYIRMKLKEPRQFVEMQEKRAQAKAKAAAGVVCEDAHLTRFTFSELFTKEYLGRTMSVVTIAGTAIIAWWAVLAWIPAWINQLTGELAVEQRSFAMFLKEIGMILSGVLGGLLIKRFGYRRCIGVSFAVAMVSAMAMFLTTKAFGIGLLGWILLLGFSAHLPFVVLWIYIPELYPARIRSTAFGFSYNIGRFVAAGAALASGALISMFGGSYAIAASSVASIYILGIVASFFMPKTSGEVA